MPGAGDRGLVLQGHSDVPFVFINSLYILCILGPEH